MRRRAPLAQFWELLVLGIIGIVLLFAAVFGVFVLHGGDLTPIIHAAPTELASIGGAAIAAMLIGSDMAKLDDFTLNLLTNDEVLAVDQDELGKQATCVIKISESGGMVADVRIYEKELSDGGRAVGFFNLGTEPVKLEFSDFTQLHLSGKQTIRDLWRQQDITTVNTAKDSLPLAIPGHGVLLYKFTTTK
jgi:hypothetical protein